MYIQINWLIRLAFALTHSLSPGNSRCPVHAAIPNGFSMFRIQLNCDFYQMRTHTMRTLIELTQSRATGMGISLWRNWELKTNRYYFLNYVTHWRYAQQTRQQQRLILSKFECVGCCQLDTNAHRARVYGIGVWLIWEKCICFTRRFALVSTAFVCSHRFSLFSISGVRLLRTSVLILKMLKWRWH